MSISASSYESNKFYESNSRDKFRAVLFKALKVLVRAPAEGYDRTYRKKDYPGIPYWQDRKDEDIQIDILGHVDEEVNFPPNAIVDPNNINWEVFILNSRVRNNINNNNNNSDDVVSANIFISESPEKPPETYTSETSVDNIILEMESTAKFKYVIGEITEGGKKSIVSKIIQLEKDCAFICSKVSMRSSTTNYSVSQIISFVMIIAPCDQVDLVKGRVESGATTYPLLYQLLCKGRFLYVINKETTTEIVKQLREEVTIFKDQFQEQSQQIEQLHGGLEQLHGDVEQLHGDVEQLHGGLEQLHGGLEQLHGDVEQVRGDLEQLRGDLDEFKKVTLNRFDETSTQLGKIETMIELIVSNLHHS